MPFVGSVDDTDNMANLGAKSLLDISMKMRLCKIVAQWSGISTEYVTPAPFLNVLNGSVSSGNRMAFQGLMIASVGVLSSADVVRMGAEVYSEFKGVITEKFGESGLACACPCVCFKGAPKWRA